MRGENAHDELTRLLSKYNKKHYREKAIRCMYAAAIVHITLKLKKKPEIHINDS